MLGLILVSSEGVRFYVLSFAVISFCTLTAVYSYGKDSHPTRKKQKQKTVRRQSLKLKETMQSSLHLELFQNLVEI